MDSQNLPELLAQDLTASEDTFRRKGTTAGAPAQALTFMSSRASETFWNDSRMNKRGLGATWEKYPADRHAAFQNYSRLFDEMSEAYSTESENAGSPVSQRNRRESIATAVTSVISNRCPEMPARKMSKPETIQLGTFLDFVDEDESDKKDEHTRMGRPAVSRGDSGIEVPLASPSTSNDDVIDPPLKTSPARHKPRVARIRAGQETSKSWLDISSGDDPECPGCVDVPLAPGPLDRRQLKIDIPGRDISALPRLSPFSPSASMQTWLDSNIVHSPVLHKDMATAGDDLFPSSLPLPQSVLNTLKISTFHFPETMLLSSSLSIETIRSYARKLRQPSDQGCSGSELLVSTHDSCILSPRSPPPSPPENQKKWFWPASRHRKGSQSKRLRSLSWGIGAAGGGNSQGRWKHFDLNLNSLKQGPAHNQGGSTTTNLSPPSWEPLSKIFRGGSDYLCDALYAHVVAYNYVSGLCSKGHKLVEVEKPKGSPENKMEQWQELPLSRIPRKAAMLLGIGGVEDITSATTPKGGEEEGQEREKGKARRGTVPGLIHPPQPTLSAEEQTQSNFLRELQSALADCVAKLVTALSREDGGSVGMEPLIIGSKVPHVDPLLFRSLCELVSFAEVKC